MTEIVIKLEELGLKPYSYGFGELKKFKKGPFELKFTVGKHELCFIF